MAKAAAEGLCADIQRLESPGPILVWRLPRLPTDQTATVRELANVDPIDVILPIIREVFTPLNGSDSEVVGWRAPKPRDSRRFALLSWRG